MKRILAAVLLFAFAPMLMASPFDEMDYGPFLSHTFQLPNNNTTLRGIAVPLIDGSGLTVGAIGVSMSSAALPASVAVKRFVPAMQDAAEQLRDQL